MRFSTEKTQWNLLRIFIFFGKYVGNFFDLSRRIMSKRSQGWIIHKLKNLIILFFCTMRISNFSQSKIPLRFSYFFFRRISRLGYSPEKNVWESLELVRLKNLTRLSSDFLRELALKSHNKSQRRIKGYVYMGWV